MADGTGAKIKDSIPLLKSAPSIGTKLVKTSVKQIFKNSEQSRYWDLRTAVTVQALDIIMSMSSTQTVSQIQNLTLKDKPIRGNIWVSKVKLPAPPEDNIRQVLYSAIEELQEPGKERRGFHEPDLLPVEAEWTGYRSKASAKSRELSISEGEKYEKMMEEVTSKTTILYLHGGALFLLDPAFYRPTTQHLAKLTGGRCFSVRYRLAPQNPFPAALLDALFAYMSLLYPLAGSYHTPVSPSDIVFAGDSAGGNLSFALLQLILQIRRQSLRIKWNGEEREVPIPAGVATSSPWLDITSCLPSIKKNQSFDYLPKHQVEYNSCSIWPADPPRKYMYTDDLFVAHPLVCPITAKNWKGSCPVYITTGWELLADEDKFMATYLAQQGVKVNYEEYEAMPHCFGLLFTKLSASKMFFESWARTILLMTEKPNDITTSGAVIRAKSLKRDKIDVLGLSSLTHEKLIPLMNEKIIENISKFT